MEASEFDNPERRNPTFEERTTTCACCPYPITQRHHWMPVKPHGENPHTIQLCSCCHELYHLIHATVVEKSEHCGMLLWRLMQAHGERERWQRVAVLVMQHQEVDRALMRNSAKVVLAMGERLKKLVPKLLDWEIVKFEDSKDRTIALEPRITVEVSAKQGKKTRTWKLLFVFKGLEIDGVTPVTAA